MQVFSTMVQFHSMVRQVRQVRCSMMGSLGMVKFIMLYIWCSCITQEGDNLTLICVVLIVTVGNQDAKY